MRVKVKFITPMMKNGALRKAGDTLEIDASSAVLLAAKGNVTIPGYTVKKEKKEIEVDTLVPIKEASK
ncbi:MAG: hypothetical protein WC346_08610 [Methanogenium sp.]|jgi:hypothetical protein